MRTSSDRILTTHVGSLPRSKAVTDVVFGRERGEEMPDGDQVISAAVDAVVARQVVSGVDVVSDGEMSKISYATYIKDRITGFDGDSDREPPRDLEEFPGFLERQAASGGTPTYRRPCCIGEIAVKDMQPVAGPMSCGRPLMVGCGPIVSVSGKVVVPASDGGVVKSETKGDHVAVCVAESVEYVFVVKVPALRDEEIRPVAGAENNKDVEEFRSERCGELGDGQVELGDVGALLLLGVSGFDLDPSGLAVPTVRDQKVHPEVERGKGNGPIADQELGGDGVFAGLAGEEVGDISHQAAVLMAVNSRAGSRSWTLAAICLMPSRGSPVRTSATVQRSSSLPSMAPKSCCTS